MKDKTNVCVTRRTARQVSLCLDCVAVGRPIRHLAVVLEHDAGQAFALGNRMVTFERRFNVPRQLSPEFLLVDLVNELDQLAEDQDAVLSRVREKAKEMDPRKLSRAVSLYGKYSTQKKFQEMLHHP